MDTKFYVLLRVSPLLPSTNQRCWMVLASYLSVTFPLNECAGILLGCVVFSLAFYCQFCEHYSCSNGDASLPILISRRLEKLPATFPTNPEAHTDACSTQSMNTRKLVRSIMVAERNTGSVRRKLGSSLDWPLRLRRQFERREFTTLAGSRLFPFHLSHFSIDFTSSRVYPVHCLVVF